MWKAIGEVPHFLMFAAKNLQLFFHFSLDRKDSFLSSSSEESSSLLCTEYEQKVRKSSIDPSFAFDDLENRRKEEPWEKTRLEILKLALDFAQV